MFGLLSQNRSKYHRQHSMKSLRFNKYYKIPIILLPRYSLSNDPDFQLWKLQQK